MYKESPNELLELRDFTDKLTLYHLQYQALKWRSADQSHRSVLPISSYKELQPLEDAFNELLILKEKMRIEVSLLLWRKTLTEWSGFLAILESLNTTCRELH